MSTVSFKRSANINEIPIVDGQLVFDETHNKIYMDNGNERLQYGGDVSLIEDVSYATSNNTFSANGSLDIFTQKLSVIDNKDSALAVTEQHVPVGCLAFQSTIGNADYSAIGNTISDSLVTLKNNITNQLSVNNNQFYFDYQDGRYGYNTDPQRGADTFSPFKSPLHFVGNQVINGRCESGGWTRTVYIYASSTILSIPLHGYTQMTINSISRCTASFEDGVLTITASGSASGSKDDHDSDYAPAYASFVVSYDITIT